MTTKPASIETASLGEVYDVTRPDISHIQTEDDTPVDNLFSEREQRLLVESLYTSWKPKSGGAFLAMSNVGFFFGAKLPPLVPDMLMSLDVTPPQGDDIHKKEGRSYFLWEYGKPPELVVEIISNREGEFDEKKKKYAQLGVTYYLIHDPALFYSDKELVCYVLQSGKYVEMPSGNCEELGLEARLWKGRYEDIDAQWLRWYDLDGKLLPTGAERAERLAEKLRKFGINPDVE